MIGKVDECMFFYEALFPSYIILINCKSGGELSLELFLLSIYMVCACVDSRAVAIY